MDRTGQVRSVCRRHAISIDADNFARVVARVSSEHSGAGEPPPGLVVAIAQEVGAQRRAEGARDRAVRAAIYGSGCQFLTDGEAPRIARRTMFFFEALPGQREAVAIVLTAACRDNADTFAFVSEAVRLATSRDIDARALAVAAEFERFGQQLRELLAAQDAEWDAAAFVKMLGRQVRKRLGEARLPADEALAEVREALSRVRDLSLARHGEHVARDMFQKASGYADYVHMFATARGLDRKLVLYVGPTNSGKTWHALAVAVAAPTARVLSPLRLLALEHYEALLEKGLAAGMVTGEEVLGCDNPTHVAQTIETMSQREVVDVAVIDEVQMLADPDRGWAWTEAIVGVPARTVVMTGSLDTVGLITRIAAMTGERLEIKTLSRMNPLHAIAAPLRIEDLKEGDAVVAFSRRHVFDLRESITTSGKSVASVYGSLSPEVRRNEARRFREGEAQILVATDAIGLGLNIGTLRRVVFSATEKYDGDKTRVLTDSELRQIAGRAGRFGFAKAGYAGVLDGGDEKRLATALSRNPEPLEMRRLFVKPTLTSILLARKHFGDRPYLELLDTVAPLLTLDSETLELGDITDMRDIARVLSPIPFPLDQAFTYSIAPVERRSDEAVETLKMWAARHAAGLDVPAPEIESTYLEDVELAAKIATLYLWLSRRFPDAYRDRDGALECRSKADKMIEAELVATSRARARRANPGRGRGLLR